MKSNIRKIIGILLAGVVFMYLWTGVALADTAPIDFDSFEDMTSTNNTSTSGNNTVSTNNTVNNTTNNTTSNTTSNITNNTTNNAVSNSTKLPQTGSNTEIIFIIGITVLAGTAITLYNKTKNK